MRLAVAWLIIWLCCGRSPTETPDPEQALRMMIDSERRVDFIGRRIVIDFDGRPAFAREERVINEAPERHRVEVLLPPEMAGYTVVRAGDRWWSLPPKHRGRPPLLPPAPWRMDPSLVIENYSLRISGWDAIAGRRAFILEIRPKHKGRPSLRAWVDASTYLPLRMERYSSSGELVSLFVYTAVDLSPEIDPELFNPPPGALEAPKPLGRELSLEEIEGKIGFRPLTPSYLPPGFRFAGAGLARLRGEEAVHLRYTDGLVLLSLFERKGEAFRGRGRRRGGEWSRAEIGGLPVDIGREGHLTILHWEQRGLSFTLIGDLGEDEMRGVARSLIERR